jgi:hypothetical protein
MAEGFFWSASAISLPDNGIVRSVADSLLMTPVWILRFLFVHIDAIESLRCGSSIFDSGKKSPLSIVFF